MFGGSTPKPPVRIRGLRPQTPFGTSPLAPLVVVPPNSLAGSGGTTICWGSGAKPRTNALLRPAADESADLAQARARHAGDRGKVGLGLRQKARTLPADLDAARTVALG